uniref:Uncharacterized protein n=1 Tax=Fagus sylvatica TaxID=28930 RepID=A0A2N9FNJ0_FAGSY
MRFQRCLIVGVSPESSPSNFQTPKLSSMSLVTDSPVNSSSSDDFAAFLDDELDSGSSNSSPEDENDNDNDLESKRTKRRKVEKLENIEELQGSTSYTSLEQTVGAGAGAVPEFFFME